MTTKSDSKPAKTNITASVRALAKILKQYDLTSLEVEQQGERIRLCRENSTVTTLTPVAHAPAPVAKPEPDNKAEQDDGTVEVTSPFVGTFYRAPSPESDPFVREGQTVEKGQALCIVEAMKLMNEIECELACTIIKILIQNGEPVEFGQALFKIRPL